MALPPVKATEIKIFSNRREKAARTRTAQSGPRLDQIRIILQAS